MELQVEKVKRIKAGGLKHYGPPYTIAETWVRMHSWASAGGLLEREGIRRFSAYGYSKQEHPEGAMPSAALLSVPSKWKPASEGEIALDLGGAIFASALYVGPYTGLGAAWEAIAKAIEARQDLVVRQGTCFEEYLNDPQTTPAAQLQTRLYMPVKQVKARKPAAAG